MSKEQTHKLKHNMPTPGEVLSGILKLNNVTSNKVATEIKVPPNRLSQIIREGRSITPDTAIRLSRFFSTKPDYWMRLQMNYDFVKLTYKNKDDYNSIVPIDSLV